MAPIGSHALYQAFSLRQFQVSIHLVSHLPDLAAVPTTRMLQLGKSEDLPSGYHRAQFYTSPSRDMRTLCKNSQVVFHSQRLGWGRRPADKLCVLWLPRVPHSLSGSARCSGHKSPKDANGNKIGSRLLFHKVQFAMEEAAGRADP